MSLRALLWGVFQQPAVLTHFRQSSCAEDLFTKCVRNAPEFPLAPSELANDCFHRALRCVPQLRVPKCDILIDAFPSKQRSKTALVRTTRMKNFKLSCSRLRRSRILLCNSAATHTAHHVFVRASRLAIFKRFPAYALSVVQRRGKALFGSPDDQAIGQPRRSALNDGFSYTQKHDFYSRSRCVAAGLEKSHKFSYILISTVSICCWSFRPTLLGLREWSALPCGSRASVATAWSKAVLAQTCT